MNNTCWSAPRTQTCKCNFSNPVYDAKVGSVCQKHVLSFCANAWLTNFRPFHHHPRGFRTHLQPCFINIKSKLYVNLHICWQRRKTNFANVFLGHHWPPKQLTHLQTWVWVKRQKVYRVEQILCWLCWCVGKDDERMTFTMTGSYSLNALSILWLRTCVGR